jgi:hypothetical protein
MSNFSSSNRTGLSFFGYFARLAQETRSRSPSPPAATVPVTWELERLEGCLRAAPASVRPPGRTTLPKKSAVAAAIRPSPCRATVATSGTHAAGLSPLG